MNINIETFKINKFLKVTATVCYLISKVATTGKNKNKNKNSEIA